MLAYYSLHQTMSLCMKSFISYTLFDDCFDLANAIFVSNHTLVFRTEYNISEAHIQIFNVNQEAKCIFHREYCVGFTL